jgi:hypothetical protein
VFRTLVPAPKDRIPLTWTNSPLVILPIVPLLVLSFLARRPGTHLLRLAILPLAVWSTLSAAFTYEWMNPVYNVYNFASGEFGFYYHSDGRQLTVKIRSGIRTLGDVRLGESR